MCLYHIRIVVFLNIVNKNSFKKEGAFIRILGQIYRDIDSFFVCREVYFYDGYERKRGRVFNGIKLESDNFLKKEIVDLLC